MTTITRAGILIKARISLQIIMTLISFLGFNQAVLVMRYRSGICLNYFENSMVDNGQAIHQRLFLRYPQDKDATL